MKLCKPGTKGNLEWLDQGNTVIGVTGNATSASNCNAPNGAYALTLTFAFTTTYANSNGACSVSGQKTYTSTPGAVIDQKQGGNSIMPIPRQLWCDHYRAGTGYGAADVDGFLVLGWLNFKRAPAASI